MWILVFLLTIANSLAASWVRVLVILVLVTWQTRPFPRCQLASTLFFFLTSPYRFSHTTGKAFVTSILNRLGILFSVMFFLDRFFLPMCFFQVSPISFHPRYSRISSLSWYSCETPISYDSYIYRRFTSYLAGILMKRNNDPIFFLHTFTWRMMIYIWIRLSLWKI